MALTTKDIETNRKGIVIIHLEYTDNVQSNTNENGKFAWFLQQLGSKQRKESRSKAHEW